MTGDASSVLPGDPAAFYRDLFALLPLAILVHDGSAVVHSNAAACRIFGARGRRTLAGTPLGDLLDRSLSAEEARLALAVVAGDTRGPHPVRFARADGSAFDGEVFASRVQADTTTFVHLVISDLTDRRAAEEEIRRGEESYRLLFEMSPDPIVVHDYERALVVNRAAVEYFAGGSMVDVLPEIWSVVAPDQREALIAGFYATGVRGRPTPPTAVRLHALTGELVEAEISSAKIRWAGEDAVVTVFRDLTERRRTQAALREVEQRYAAVVQHAPLGMHFYRLEQDGRLLFTGANPAADDILGVDHGELAGMTIEEAWPGLRNTPLPGEYRKVAREGAVFERAAMSYDDGKADGTFEVHVFSNGPGCCVAMFWDVSERIRDEIELDQYRHRLEQLVVERTRALDQAHRDVDAIAVVAARAVELRDPYTAGHQRRASELSQRIALRMGFSDESAEQVRIAANLHDIGKLSVPVEILSKPGALSRPELELVRGHAGAAYEILKEARTGWPLAEIVGQHHERLDGSGYPAGITGDEIRIEARILAVADVVEAMASHRPYRPSLGLAAAAEEIGLKSGVLYDPEVVSACLGVLESGFRFSDSA